MLTPTLEVDLIRDWMPTFKKHETPRRFWPEIVRVLDAVDGSIYSYVREQDLVDGLLRHVAAKTLVSRDAFRQFRVLLRQKELRDELIRFVMSPSMTIVDLEELCAEARVRAALVEVVATIREKERFREPLTRADVTALTKRAKRALDEHRETAARAADRRRGALMRDMKRLAARTRQA
ncbi:MAG: hypothetical protein ACHREM_03390 [Polyangiales bacterium]